MTDQNNKIEDNKTVQDFERFNEFAQRINEALKLLNTTCKEGEQFVLITSKSGTDNAMTSVYSNQSDPQIFMDVLKRGCVVSAKVVEDMRNKAEQQVKVN